MKEEKERNAMHGNPETCPTNPLDPPDPLAQPDVMRILLSEPATAASLEAGECFPIVGKGTNPNDPSRMVTANVQSSTLIGPRARRAEYTKA